MHCNLLTLAQFPLANPAQQMASWAEDWGATTKIPVCSARAYETVIEILDTDADASTSTVYPIGNKPGRITLRLPGSQIVENSDEITILPGHDNPYYTVIKPYDGTGKPPLPLIRTIYSEEEFLSIAEGPGSLYDNDHCHDWDGSSGDYSRLFHGNVHQKEPGAYYASFKSEGGPEAYGWPTRLSEYHQPPMAESRPTAASGGRPKQMQDFQVLMIEPCTWSILDDAPQIATMAGYEGGLLTVVVAVPLRKYIDKSPITIPPSPDSPCETIIVPAALDIEAPIATTLLPGENRPGRVIIEIPAQPKIKPDDPKPTMILTVPVPHLGAGPDERLKTPTEGVLDKPPNYLPQEASREP
ncbi:hypothetical protein B0I35DRAFT_504608 [Stachybotrys elegans]|uniref:Uncharacterized protein n=1 Tax=Stachybotrys elegans TaxID=80388 RepID=A0A8K0SQL1_9HYPO|nr:hypothetical protein B0I35DRAFT_504608 [Stachybotrys elegans]